MWRVQHQLVPYYQSMQMWGVLRPIYMYQPIGLSTPKLPYEEPLVWEISRVVNQIFLLLSPSPSPPRCSLPAPSQSPQRRRQPQPCSIHCSNDPTPLALIIAIQLCRSFWDLADRADHVRHRCIDRCCPPRLQRSQLIVAEPPRRGDEAADALTSSLGLFLSILLTPQSMYRRKLPPLRRATSAGAT